MSDDGGRAGGTGRRSRLHQDRQEAPETTQGERLEPGGHGGPDGNGPLVNSEYRGWSPAYVTSSVVSVRPHTARIQGQSFALESGEPVAIADPRKRRWWQRRERPARKRGLLAGMPRWLRRCFILLLWPVGLILAVVFGIIDGINIDVQLYWQTLVALWKK